MLIAFVAIAGLMTLSAMGVAIGPLLAGASVIGVAVGFGAQNLRPAPLFCPLRMQGVEEFGDYGIRLRLKLVTRPGEQFPIRRRAYQRIKELFDLNGVRFAVPTHNLPPSRAARVPISRPATV